ncbi:MAG: hypothetical protein R3E39_15945 [Anaerolineae bacterium]
MQPHSASAQDSISATRDTTKREHIDYPWRYLFSAVFIEFIIIVSIHQLRVSSTASKAVLASSLLTNHVHTVQDVAFSGDLMAVADVISIRLYEHGQLVHEFEGHDQSTTNRHIALAFSPDGHQLATLASAVENDKPFAILKVWDVTSYKIQLDQVVHQGGLDNSYFAVALVYSPDGQWLASGAGDGYIVITNVGDGMVSARLFNYSTGTYGLAFSDDSLYLSVLSHTGSSWSASHQGGAAELWDIRDLSAPTLKKSISLSPYSMAAASISSDGRFFAGSEHYWDNNTSVGQLQNPLDASIVPNAVTASVFSPSGDLLAYQVEREMDGEKQPELHIARWQGDGGTTDAFPVLAMEEKGIYHLNFRQTESGLVLSFMLVSSPVLIEWNLDTGMESRTEF